MNSSSPLLCRSKLVAALGFFLLGAFAARPSFSQSFSASLRCGTTDTISIGQVLRNDTVNYPLQLIDHFLISDSTWKVRGGIPAFHLQDTSGRADSGTTWTTSIFFAADSTPQTITQTISIISDNDTACKTNLVFLAQVIKPTQNDTTFSLQDTTPKTIAIETNSDSADRTFNFKNNSDTAIVIDSITIQGTSAFLITSKPKNNDTVSARDSFAVGIAYHRNSIGYDNGYLAISMPNRPILPAIALQGIRTSDAAVQTQPGTSTYVSLYPNPTRGSVTIHTDGLTHESVTITDVLGRTLRKATCHGDWIWDRADGFGGVAVAGTYFVIVTGYDENGNPVHEVKRIVLE